MASKRQQQVAHLVQEALTTVLLRHKQDFIGAAFATVMEVKLSPDLLVARVYISVLQEDALQTVIERLTAHNKNIRGLVGNYLKNKVRRIPEIVFIADNTLEKAGELEAIFKAIRGENSNPE